MAGIIQYKALSNVTFFSLKILKKSIFLLIPFIDASHNFITIVYRKNKCQMQIQMSIIKWDYVSTKTYCTAHGNLFNVMWQPGWEGSLGENGYLCMYGWSFPYSPDTMTTLLIGYSPIQNKKFIFKKTEVVQLSALCPMVCLQQLKIRFGPTNMNDQTDDLLLILILHISQ